MTRGDADKLVLAADDDPISRLLTRQMVELAGLACMTASDGRDAVAKALRHSPDLVLMDMHMPNMGGIEAARTIRDRLGAAAPVIVAISSDCSAAIQKAAVEAGIAEYVLKPVSVDLVFRLLDTHLPRKTC